MQAMVHWDDMRYLLAAHRDGSLAAAARTLGVDATTVARRIAALERALGARLITRTRSGLRATTAGLGVVTAAARVNEAVEVVEREVAGADTRLEGRVRVTSGEGVLARVLAPALPGLRARHPGLRVELIAASRALDLLHGEADLAVRLFRPREPGLVARRLTSLSYGLFAAPSYLARAGAPRNASELAGHDVLGFDASLEPTPEMRWLARHVPPAAMRFRTSSTVVLLAACEAGAGIAALPERLTAGLGLARVLPRADLPDREAWLVMHPDLRRTARIVAVSAWIGETLRQSASGAT
jgi:DNA-binding transcriptional LysR family regulator